jgi:L-histidine N-alpha-methyltransferase
LSFEARWDAGNEWMDIGFRARSAHEVRIAELEILLPLAENEQLRFEVSTKFRREGLERELIDAGLELDGWWTDADGDFALVLARPTGAQARGG